MPIPALSITTGKVVEFLISWLVSGVIIYIVLKIYPGKQKRENIGGALLTALLGEIVYTAFHWLGLPLASILALPVWLYILKKMFGVSWIGAAFIAFLVFVFSVFVGLLGIPRLL